ncbi:MAG: 2-phospho-L-lactate guanylyltransferase [Chloroflexi bacterium]|nr:2-phospho-L-lactate guanylyltransferase [Chloroflexota bacterium]MBA3739696.1 2-phospho-L-lactate guanylyltransferase [Chloroflexota bacterium]
MSTRIIVPHRGLEAAKTRLAPSLSPDERMFLASQLLQRVLKVAREVTDDVVVISPSRPLLEIVEPSGARLVIQRGMGLNTGLDEVRFDALVDHVTTLVVLHGDLPNLQALDIETLLAALPADGSPGVAIAPDRAGRGTNAIVLRPPGVIGFRFGAGSFALHLEEVERAGVPLVAVNRAGLAFDLDTPEDLARWLERGDAA